MDYLLLRRQCVTTLPVNSLLLFLIFVLYKEGTAKFPLLFFPLLFFL